MLVADKREEKPRRKGAYSHRLKPHIRREAAREWEDRERLEDADFEHLLGEPNTPSTVSVDPHDPPGRAPTAVDNIDAEFDRMLQEAREREAVNKTRGHRNKRTERAAAKRTPSAQQQKEGQILPKGG